MFYIIYVNKIKYEYYRITLQGISDYWRTYE